MPVTATPAFAQTPVTGSQVIVPADTIILKEVITGGANGTILDSIVVTSTDTSAKDLQFWVTSASAVPAYNTLTGTATNVNNNETVVIGSKTYTFQTTLTNVDGNVKIGASAALSLTNLVNAINRNAGVVGTDYATAMTVNTQVTAQNPTTTTMFVRAITAGAVGNSIATTETSTQLSWATTTLTGGFDSNSYDYLLATISIPANSGFTSSIALVDILDNARMGTTTGYTTGYPTFDPNGNRILRLKAGEILKAKVLVAVTAAKAIYITARGANL